MEDQSKKQGTRWYLWVMASAMVVVLVVVHAFYTEDEVRLPSLQKQYQLDLRGEPLVYIEISVPEGQVFGNESWGDKAVLWTFYSNVSYLGEIKAYVEYPANVKYPLTPVDCPTTMMKKAIYVQCYLGPALKGNINLLGNLLDFPNPIGFPKMEVP